MRHFWDSDNFCMFRGCMTEYDTYDVSFSCITFETETEPLSFINIVGRYACLVFVLGGKSCCVRGPRPGYRVYGGVSWEYIKCCDDNFVASAGWSSGSKSICMRSSGPKTQSCMLISSGVSYGFSFLQLWTQVWHSFTRLWTWFAKDGN